LTIEDIMKRLGLVSVGLAAGFGAGLVFLPLAHGDAVESPSTYHELDRFGEAFAKIRADYVTPTEDKQLVEDALQGMISDLDPHSSYFDPKTFADMQVKTEGQYGGVGLVIAAEDGGIKIISAMDDTPASKAGIKSGDMIIGVDGQALKNATIDDVQKKLRGAAGTKVSLTLMRSSEKKSYVAALVRQAIQVEAVKWHREGDVGYIRIPAFNENTDNGLQTGVRELRKQIGPGIKGYIIDLRDDGGGVLDQAIAVSDDFLESGEIVSTRGRHPQDAERYDAKPGDITGGKPVIVLINGGTASASEIVAGALQDHKRAQILGTTSFGKGSVQTIMPLNNGEDGALHLTTGRYYTPSGRSIQAYGITPDIGVASSQKEADDEIRLPETEALLAHHLDPEGQQAKQPPAVLIKPEPSKKYDDFQLTYATEVLDGKVKSGVVASKDVPSKDAH
jgi:carboxyl-terminal processing protease